MSLFDNGNTEEFLLFVRNFRIALEASVNLADNAKLQYLCMLLSGEALCQLDTLCAHLGSTTTTYLNRVILGLDA